MIKNRDLILGLEGGRAIVEALEAVQDDLQRNPLKIGPVVVRVGDASPEGRFDDPTGSLYLRTNVDGGTALTLYVKELRTRNSDPRQGWNPK